MGDVFDAMNRAKREREQAGASSAPASQSPRGDVTTGPIAPDRQGPEQPALPLDQVPPPPVEERQTVHVTAPAMPRDTVTRATERSRIEQTPTPEAATDLQTDDRATGDRAAIGIPPSTSRSLTDSRGNKLNGYAEDVVVHHDRGSFITEQYRALRTQILARARNRRLQTHVLTSAAPEEGKTVTTINLGFAFAELRNQRTLLVEGDLRRPSFHTYFDRDCKPGMLQLLNGEETDLDRCLHQTVYDNLQFLPAGGRESTRSTELLTSPRMAQILDRLKDRYDHIFIDTPPVVTVTDGCILGAQCDQAMLVVRLNKTPSEVVERAKRLLRAANVELAGIILTHLQAELAKYRYAYRYSYGGGSGKS